MPIFNSGQYAKVGEHAINFQAQGNISIYVMPEDQLLQLNQRLSTELKRRGVGSVPSEVISSILTSMEVTPDGWNTERTLDILIEKLIIYGKILKDWQALKNDDPTVENLRNQAEHALNNGDFEVAERLLICATDIISISIHTLDSNIKSRRVSAAKTYADAAEIAFLQVTHISYKNAANYYKKAASIVHEYDIDLSYSYIYRQAQIHYINAIQFGRDEDFNCAITIFSSLLQKIDKKESQELFFEVSKYFVDALSHHGNRNKDVAILEVALASYNEILDTPAEGEYDQKRLEIQNSMGNTLLALGTIDNDIAHFKNAFSIFKKLLKIHKKNNEHSHIATIQCNLGCALLNIGIIKQNKKILKKAVDEYRNSLASSSADEFPSDIGRKTHNLGCALLHCGMLESMTNDKSNGNQLPSSAAEDFFREAKETFLSALSFRNRTKEPLNWAETQYVLGCNFLEWAEINEDVELLKKAEEAFRYSLMEWTDKTAPNACSKAQGARLEALMALGQKENSSIYFSQAADVVVQTLKGCSQENDPERWTSLQNLLAFLKVMTSRTVE